VVHIRGKKAKRKKVKPLAVILSITRDHHRSFRVVFLGRNREQSVWVYALDEIGAFVRVREIIESKGYRI
jgi:hypothetical protein